MKHTEERSQAGSRLLHSGAARGWLAVGVLLSICVLTGCTHILSGSAGGTGQDPSVVGNATISAAYINSVLSAAGSPAAGDGWAFVQYSDQYHVDDAFALAVFRQESSFGTTGVARQTDSIGNMIPNDIDAPFGNGDSGGFQSYPSWANGIEGFYALVRTQYINKMGLTTVGQIYPDWDTDDPQIQQIVANLCTWTEQYRAQGGGNTGSSSGSSTGSGGTNYRAIEARVRSLGYKNVGKARSYVEASPVRPNCWPVFDSSGLVAVITTSGRLFRHYISGQWTPESALANSLPGGGC